MPVEIVVQNALIAHGCPLVDIGIAQGRIAFVGDEQVSDTALRIDAEGRVVTPGLVDSHIHLDKSHLCDRCGPSRSVASAIARVSELKLGMTEEDIYERARRTLMQAVVQGTSHLRAHVEIDSKIGLKGFRAILALKREFAWAISVQICIFPQEGLTNDPESIRLMQEAVRSGADLIGGCPYADVDPKAQIDWVFKTAVAYDLDIDFHLDFDLSPDQMSLPYVCEKTNETGWGGRVSVGHVTKLAAIDDGRLVEISGMLRDAGVAVTVLPATDMFLVGQRMGSIVPRSIAPILALAEHGVLCSVATNNVMNPFTPFGDCSLVRMANFMLNVSQRGDEEAVLSALGMIESRAALLMNIRSYGLDVGAPADLVILDAMSHVSAIAEIAPLLFGMKAGQVTFTRSTPRIHWPDSAAPWNAGRLPNAGKAIAITAL